MSHRHDRFGTHGRVRALTVVVAVATLLVGAAGPAEAHDHLVATSPADGSTTDVVPGQVTLTFDQPALALGTLVVVTGPAGQVQTGPAILVDNTITERLRPGSPAGRYTVAWRVTSTDGHPVSDRFSFNARSPSPGEPADATPAAVSTVPAGSIPAVSDTKTAPHEHSAAHLWVAASWVLMLLVLGVFIATLRARATRRGERDPRL